MGSLNSASLVDKLSKLNSTQASIETLSEWCNFYRREAGRIVGIWDEEFNKATPVKRLVLLYLANDILQNSRKKVTFPPSPSPLPPARSHPQKYYPRLVLPPSNGSVHE